MQPQLGIWKRFSPSLSPRTMPQRKYSQSDVERWSAEDVVTWLSGVSYEREWHGFELHSKAANVLCWSNDVLGVCILVVCLL